MDLCAPLSGGSGWAKPFEYKWENKDRNVEIFGCVLVSIHDPSEYCAAEVRKVKGSPADVLQKAEETYKSGLKFLMSDVELNMKAKPEYNNTPCKITIDLTKTKMTKLLQSGVSVSPEPTITCSECVQFNTVQACDIPALVDETSAPREVGGQRRVRDVYLIDGSLSDDSSGEKPPTAKQTSGEKHPTEPKNLIRLRVQVFYELKQNGQSPEFIDQIMNAAKKPQPFHFYGMTAQLNTKGYQIETMRSWYYITAAKGNRADELRTVHPSLLEAVQNTPVRTLQST